MQQAWSSRQQHVTLVMVAVVALGMTAMLTWSRPEVFLRFFGRVPVRWLVTAATVAGCLALVHLRNRADLQIVRGRASLRGAARAASLGTALTATAVVADIWLRFPADINVPPPAALIFYPAIAWVVEMVFHAVPMVLLLLGLRSLEPPTCDGSRGSHDERDVRIGIAVVSLLEPLYQLALAPRLLAWTTAFTVVQVFVINLAQLHVWRRYDFMSMLVLRLVYYAGWHLAWGVLRLHLLQF